MDVAPATAERPAGRATACAVRGLSSAVWPASPRRARRGCVRARSFTLIEVIAVVLIVGILGSVTMMGVAAFLDGFVTGRSNAELTQKAQNALQRLVMELRFLEPDAETGQPLPVVSEDHAALTFTSKRDGALHAVALVGSELRLDGQPLTDRVNAFQAFFTGGTGEVRLVLTMDQVGSFETSVFP